MKIINGKSRLQEEGTMTRRRIFSMGLALMALGMVLGMSAPAAAGDDPLLIKPVVLLIIDTSGSMGFGYESGYNPDFPEPTQPMPCGLNNSLKCNRMQIVIEALTGSYTQEGSPDWQSGYCDGSQEENGIFDGYKDSVRFAVASFDSSYSNYSYGDPGFKYGIKPRSADGCSGFTCLVDFLDTTNPGDTRSHNAELEQKICGFEGGYGEGTPLGASLYDADWYLKKWQDETSYDDVFWDCRPKYVILFTDGNESSGAVQAKGNVVQTAGELFANTVPNELPEAYWPGKTTGVPVFLVGMGNRADYDADPTNYPVNVGILDNANSVGTGGVYPEAFIAEGAESLRAQFDAILGIILAGSSSRTEISSQPSMSFNKSYQYKAYLDVTEAGPWEGHLVREEIADPDGDGVPEYIGDPLLFEDKLAAQNPEDRKIYSMFDDPRSRDHDLFRDMDEFKSGTAAGTDEALMCLPSSPRLPNDDDDKDATVGDYADYIKDFVRGVSGKKSRNKGWVTDGNPWLGDIFHATPVVVGPPSSLAPDYKYEAYFLRNWTRDTMVYAGANDGMMHAFVGEDVDSPANDGKELWAFVPTKILSTIQNTRGMHRTYVDSTPVIRDVYFNEIQEKDQLGDELASKGAYRTVLIGGLRGGGNAYYALDVTNPEDPRYLWEYRPGVLIAEDGGVPVYPYEDPAVQCKQDIAQSWAKPIVGQIWVKRADDDTYEARSVAMIPGGFMPGTAFGTLNTCIELIEMTVFPSTLHVVDIETGKLLKKYSFTDDGAYDDLLDELEDYYELMAAGNDNPWNHNNGQCAAFHTEDYDPDSNEGWGCAEMRANLQNPPSVPLELLADNLCWECPGDPGCGDLPADVKYAKVCCANKKTEEVPGIQQCCKNNDGTCKHDEGKGCHLCDSGFYCLGDPASGNCICTKRLPGCTECDDDSDCPVGEVCDALVCETALGVHACWGEQQMGTVEVMAASRCDSLDMNHLKNGSCSYYTMEFENGSVDKWLKTEGCFLVENEDQGRLCFHVGGNFLVNGVAANPVAYNTTFGEFITRSFMPTTGGVIWRLDMGNGLYDDTADEGMMIEGYTDPVTSVSYEWNASKFFDVTTIEDPETKPTLIKHRPIMAPPALGLTYNRSLVMFFGTGRTDDLEYYDDRDYFFAVEEVLDDTTGKPTGFGELFDRDGTAAATALKFDDGERLYGKPLVAAGKVIINTFISNPDICEEGTGKMYIFDYDHTPEDTSGVLSYSMSSTGTPSSPTMVWTPTGPVVLVQQGAGVEVLPVADQIKPTAHALHWGQVL